MKEIKGNLWDYYRKRGYIVCLTTNGTVKNNGEAVMGRGCALEATKRIPGIAKKLGEKIRVWGNETQWIDDDGYLLAFPVKHNWWEKADLELIKESAEYLKEIAEDRENEGMNFILPRPGCGNGKRTWEEVKPLLEDLPDNVLVIDYA